MTGAELRSERLVLRRWRETDREPFHALNSDPAVMATIGPVMSRGQSDAFMNRIERHFDEHGFGVWCVEVDGRPVGYTGFMVPWFRDGVEIGWRIRSDDWGRGIAPEAARACLALGFGELGFDEVFFDLERFATHAIESGVFALIEVAAFVNAPHQLRDRPAVSRLGGAYEIGVRDV